jgi:hypothetical protein
MNASEFCGNFNRVTRHQLEHIIRAAAANADVRDIVVVGSSAILGSFPSAPTELTESIEADVFPKDLPERSIVIDGAMGELSLFHDTFGYYAHGVDESTATLPSGWRERLVRIESPNTMGSVGWCLEVHDLAVSKLVAGREKDREFVKVLIAEKLASLDVIKSRLAQTSLKTEHSEIVEARLKSWVAET